VLFTIFKFNNVMICYDISAISITNYVMARWSVMKWWVKAIEVLWSLFSLWKKKGNVCL